MTRWDSPLFTVLYDDETPPFEQIWDAMVGSDGKAKVVRPNQATVLVCCENSRLSWIYFDTRTDPRIKGAC